MKYWLSNGDGQVYGPYTVEELRGFAASGRVTNMSQLCQEGTNAWVPATTMLGVGLAGVPPTEPPPSPPSWSTASATPVSWQPVSLVAPILSILFCCMPEGIVSLVYATNANSKGAMGNIPGAEADKKLSAMWLRLSVLPMVGMIIVYLVIAIVAGVTNW